MIGAVLRPLRGAVQVVAALPRVVEAILVLPSLSRQLDEVTEHTAHLAAILTELEGVRGDTTSLPVINANLERMCTTLGRVEENTLAVEQLAEIALPLQGAAMRVGRFADRLPQRRAVRPTPTPNVPE
jgi:hypothetical protein